MALTKGTTVDYLSLVTELDNFITADWVDTIAINAAGTGYTAGDILTVAGGTTTHHAAQIRVLTVGGSGEILTARLWDSGGYSADPTLSANTVTGGTGSAATFDLTMLSDPWSIVHSETIFSTEEARIYQGPGGGGVFCGFRTYQEDIGARQARNWALFGCSSYNGALPWYQQPDFPSGYGIDTSTGAMTATATPGCFAVFKDNDGFPMDYWIHVTGRRIIVIAKLVDNVTTTPRYSSLYMGLLNPMGTSDEFPYPLYLCGSSSTSRCAWDDLAPAFHFNGITQVGATTTANGPAMYFSVDGFWKSVSNWNNGSFGSSSRSEQNQYTVSPCGQMALQARTVGEDIATDSPSTNLCWERIISMSGLFSSPAEFQMWPTPDSAGAKRLLVPCVLTISNTSIEADYHIVGELDGVYWVSAAGSSTLTSEDTLDDADTAAHYRAYQNGVYNQLDGYMALRED